MSVASSSKDNTSLSDTTDQQQKQHFSSSSRSPPSRNVKQQEIDSASDASGNSGESSDLRDLDILAQVLSTRSEEYRLLFRLPSDEVLIQDFNCALQENILLQGHLYLFIHHICFYSNIFGFETKLIIVVLLTRSREVHLISEMYNVNGLNSDNEETIDWLEMRFFYLTEEMLVMETRLERMHQEYKLLKAHLQAISQFKHKT